MQRVNAGIINADAINTVSKTHVDEIQTPEYGEGLEEILKKNNHKLFGILNGLDRDEFNPARDKKIKTNYNYRQLFRRAENKLALQKEFKLPADPRIPIFAISGRMERQKGIEILMEALPKLMENFKFQFLALGGGEESFRQFLWSYRKNILTGLRFTPVPVLVCHGRSLPEPMW